MCLNTSSWDQSKRHDHTCEIPAKKNLFSTPTGITPGLFSSISIIIIYHPNTIMFLKKQSKSVTLFHLGEIEK